MMVSVREVKSGGRVGETCVTVGGFDARTLDVLHRCAEALIKTSSERGLQQLLDALCTRSPPRLDCSPYLLEEDGLPGSPTNHSLQVGEPILSSAAHRMSVTDATKKNRVFLNRLQPSHAKYAEEVTAAPVEKHQGDPTASPSYIANLKSADFIVRALTQSIHFARREVMLYFIRHDVVPISVLAGRYRLERQTNIFIPHNAFTAQCLADQPHLRADSFLERSKSFQKRKESNMMWMATIEASQETNGLLLLAAQRLLCTAYPCHTELFGKDMWSTYHQPMVSTPVFAAFSPSGLLMGSKSFFSTLGHRHRFLLATAAVNSLTSYPLQERDTRSRVLNWSTNVFQFPLTITTTMQGSDTVDFCVCAFGDGVSIVVGLSRSIQRQRGIEMETLVKLLQRSDISDGVAPPSGMDHTYFRALSYHLHVLCTQNLCPTQEFFSSVCALATLEGKLRYDAKTEEIGVDPVFIQTLNRLGSSYYGDGLVFGMDRCKSAQEQPPPTLQVPTRPDAAVDSGCGFCACLPFCGAKPKEVTQKAFAAERKRLATATVKANIRSIWGAEEGVEESLLGKDVLPFHRKGLLLMLPLAAMWYHVGSWVGMGERLAFRALEGTGVHSAFWVVQPSCSPPALHDGSEDLHQSLFDARYAVGFFRPQVERSYRTLSREEQIDVFHLQNPATTLDAIRRDDVQPPADEGECGEAVLENQVLVLPVSSIEVMAPSPLHCTIPRELKDIPVTETDGGEEHLLTSLYLCTEEKVSPKRKKHKPIPLPVKMESGGDAAGPSSTTSGGATITLPKYARVDEVINLDGECLTDERNVLRTLETRRIPSAFSKRRDPERFDPERCTEEVRELCAELALCKEAVMTLYYGALDSAV